MVNVKINGKTYKVGEMKFGDFTHIELAQKNWLNNTF